MRAACLITVVLILLTSLIDAKKKKRYQPINYFFKPAKLKQPYKDDPNHLLNSDFKNPALTKVVNPGPDSILESPGVDDNNGIDSEIRIIKQDRPLVRDANLGRNTGPPGYVPRDEVIQPKEAAPPNPSVLEPPQQNLKRMSRKERNQVAQVSNLFLPVFLTLLLKTSHLNAAELNEAPNLSLYSPYSAEACNEFAMPISAS